MEEPFDVLERCPGVLYGACGGIWVMTLFAPPATADMLRARPALAAMSARHAQGFPTLTWVLPQAGLSMESEARKAAADVTREFNGAIRAQATVIEGAGFRAATVRAIVAGMDMMSRSTCPKKAFADVSAAVTWCLEHHARKPSAAATKVAESIRSARGTLPAG